MNRKILILLIFVIFLTTYVVSSLDFIKLEKGKNVVNWTINQGISVEQLIMNYPQIQAITYYDENNMSHGFINVFSGIGENFILIAGNQYQIDTKEEVVITL
jgi:hypothetical protein